MTSNELKTLTHQYVMNTYGRFPVAIDRGEGARLYDFEGNEYIDFTSGIGVTDLGYGNEAWAEAIGQQAKKTGPCVQPVLHRAGCQTGGNAVQADRHEQCVFCQRRRRGQ